MIFVDNDELDLENGYVHKRASGITVGPLKDMSKKLSYLAPDCLAGEFTGVNTFLNFLQTDMPYAKFRNASTQWEPGFNFFRSYEEAVRVYQRDPRSIRHFDEKDEKLEGGESSGKQVEFGVTGDFLDIGRFVEGDPEAFGSMTDGNPRGKRVQIILNISWSCGVSEQVINARCSRIARLIDWLESQQVRCRVIAVESTTNSHLEIVVKEFDEVLDLNDVAVVSHSDFLRRAVFRFKEWSNTVSIGYGTPTDLSFKVSTRTFLPEYNSEYTVFVDSQVNTIQTVGKHFDDLERWLEENISGSSLSPEERVRMLFH